MRKPKLPKRLKQSVVRKDKTRTTKKKIYKVRNWKEYNESLVRRGSLEFWIEKGIAEVWQEDGRIIIRKKRGAQKQYSDSAIELNYAALWGKYFISD